jgi:diguanylate cyclase (GGDEF)-like protein
MNILNLSTIIIKLLLFILLIPTFASASQKTPLSLDKYFAQTWNTRDGLPHNAINALAQSEDGYLWAATWEGLARFNGREFKVFVRGSATGLPDSAVKSLTARANGDLLIAGARGGLSERKNRIWHPKDDAETLINHAIYDNEQGIWLGLEAKGLVFRDSQSDKESTIIADVRVFKIAQTLDNTIWLATNKGLYSVINKNEVTHYGPGMGLPDVPVYTVMITKQQQLVIGTERGVYTLENNKFISLEQRLNTEAVMSLLQDSNDDIWIGTTDNGLYRLSDNGLEKLDDNKGLPNNRIVSMVEDKEQSIWVGTSAGLFRLREAPFITLTAEQGLSGNYVRSVLSHSNGSLWVGSSKGLSQISGNKVETIKAGDNERNISVLSLAEGINGAVLVGSYTQGVFNLVNDELVPDKAINSRLDSKEVRSILVDSEGSTWVGTTAGIVKFSKTGEVQYINKQSGLPANFIMALAEDDLGQVWIGTGVGVASYRAGVLKTYSLTDRFDAEYAFGFHIEPGAVWMATDRGILRIDLATSKIDGITRENGLPIDKFFQIVVDKSGAFWLTSNRGVIKIAGQEIENVLAGKATIVDYQIFKEEAGLLSSQANGGSTPAATLHSDGTVWLATAKGVSQVSQYRLNRVAEQQLPVTIEQFIVDGNDFTIPEDNNITLPAGVTHLAIYYAGLGFLNSDRIQYQTQLVGFDKDWLDKKHQTYTEFTNLPPGQYTFQMRAKYPDGKWHKQVASLTFNMEYYYWQTRVFKLAMIIVFFLVLYIAYRYRLIKIQLNEERLKQLITKQTIELKQQAKLFAHQATHDQLTGLPNRRAFDNWCESDFSQAKSGEQELSLAIIDIDYFKRVNDNYSHIIGDKVIQTIAKILSQHFAQHKLDIKCARWGGEEFTLLIPTNKEQATEICETVRTVVQSYDFHSIAHGLSITISIGLMDNIGDSGYDEVITLADKALYFAKHNGRNQVIVYSPQVILKDRRIEQYSPTGCGQIE